jgi:beta-ureidopropionase / N-carbamoyl-L-amino-acid hydrolase
MRGEAAASARTVFRKSCRYRRACVRSFALLVRWNVADGFDFHVAIHWQTPGLDTGARFHALAGPRTVWTTGKISLDPGARSIIPGRAEALFQIRDTEVAILERLENALHDLVKEANAAGPCALSVVRMSASQPAQMDERFIKVLATVAQQEAPDRFIHMPSGAAHDAQFIARKLPIAMMFVPSIRGISHHWSEDTSDEDIVLGAKVFANAIVLALKTSCVDPR